MGRAEDDADALTRRLADRRALARAVLWVERLWPALWPPLGVAGLFLVIALLGLPALLPPLVHAALLLVFAVAIVALLARGLRAVRAPDDAAADRRMERATGLAHRPLATLADKPAGPDGAALWAAHRARAAEQVRRLRVGWPRPGLAALDRRALRLGLLVALVAAVVIAGEDAPARLGESLFPALPRAAAAPGVQVQAWITPPAYTHLPPQFLRPEGGAVSAPAGAHLTVSVTGGVPDPSAPPALSLAGHAEPMRAIDAASFQADRDLTVGGRIAVRRDGHDLAAWDLTVLAERAPVAAWSEPPGPARQELRTRLPWQASDDYGVTALQAELRLEGRPEAPPLVVAIPLPGGAPRSAHGVAGQDLTAHPWAGLPVTARLVARNAPGLAGESADATFVLPERAFRHPVARALQALRKELSLHPDDRRTALAGLDELLVAAPDQLAGDYPAFLNLTAIYHLLVRDRSDEAVAQAQERMWRLALHLEEGATERTARALEQARAAVREAMEQATRDPSDANREALDRALQQLEAAIARHMEALAEQARREESEMPLTPDAQRLDEREMQRRADEARDAARRGDMDQARQKMAELERMLDQLREAQVRPGRNGENQKRAEQRQRGRQQMGAVQDMIGREGGLMDRAQSRAPAADPRGLNRFDPRPQAAPPGAGTGAEPPPADKRDQATDLRTQQALRRALGELMQQFGDLTGQVPPSLGEADGAMREALGALGRGQDSQAQAAEQRAVEALQKGGQEMGQAMARQFGNGRQGDEDGQDEGDQSGGSAGFSLQDGPEGQGDGLGDAFGDRRGEGTGRPSGTPPGRRAHGERRDPLGRQLGSGTGGQDGEDGTRVPGEMERMRTQAIQEELRRRGAERERPREELDYIDRLLKQF
jgi:uncharacterized protein (TIGR02302 family)